MYSNTIRLHIRIRICSLFQILCHYRFSSVQFSPSVVSDSLRPHELQHARPPCGYYKIFTIGSLCYTARFLLFIHFIYSSVYMRRQWHPTPVLLPGKSHGRRSLVGCSPWGHEESDITERLHFHSSFHTLEKEMATHSSVLAWRIPGTGKPGGLPSMGSHRVGHD